CRTPRLQYRRGRIPGWQTKLTFSLPRWAEPDDGLPIVSLPRRAHSPPQPSLQVVCLPSPLRYANSIDRSFPARAHAGSRTVKSNSSHWDGFGLADLLNEMRSGKPAIV